MARPILGLIAIAAGALWSPAQAQDEAPANVSPETPPTPDASEPARETSVAAGAKAPGPSLENQDEILVTAPSTGPAMRVPSTSDDKAAAAAAAARTPCAGCVEVSGSSVSIGFGRPPPMPLMIDLKAIPEAPPGSAAAAYSEE